MVYSCHAARLTVPQRFMKEVMSMALLGKH